MKTEKVKSKTCGTCRHHSTDGVCGKNYCGNENSPTYGRVTTVYCRCERHEGKGEPEWKAS